MRGSGLSLERFGKGKAQKRKEDARSKKKQAAYKAQRRKAYAKVQKKQEKEEPSTNGPESFYDRFFRELQEEDDGKDDGKNKPSKESPVNKEESAARPDPFFKQKQKAEALKQEKAAKQAEKERHRQEVEQKIQARKKRHVKLSVRTKSGQPVVRNQIKDILSRLEKDKRQQQQH